VTDVEQGKAWKSLIRLLRYRPRSVAEARRRLQGKGFSRAEVDATIERAVAGQLLDDELFARLWIEDRLHAHPLSRRAIELELGDLGVARLIVQQQLAQLYPAERERELAFRLAAERFQQLRMRNIEADKRTSRVTSYLTRRGFPYSLTHSAVRAAERDDVEEEGPSTELSRNGGEDER